MMKLTPVKIPRVTAEPKAPGICLKVGSRPTPPLDGSADGGRHSGRPIIGQPTGCGKSERYYHS